MLVRRALAIIVVVAFGLCRADAARAAAPCVQGLRAPAVFDAPVVPVMSPDGEHVDVISRGPHIAAAAKVAPCASGRFLPDVALVSGDAAPVTDAIILAAGSRLSIGSSRRPARATPH